MAEKRFFLSLKKIVPTELEYYLEEKAAEGEMLLPIGEMGLFYFQFEETKPQKCKYVVDRSALDKEMYRETLEKKGWEYLGTTADFYVWRQTYETKRPEDFTDQSYRAKHAKKIGIIFLLVGLACLALLGLFIHTIYLERSMGSSQHTVIYSIGAVLQIPFIAYFLWAARKLISFR